MSEQGKLSCMVLITALAVLPATTFAAQGMVMMTGDCPYMVLDSRDGQMLVKRVTGTAPEVGDILEGQFRPKTFTRVTNQRTGDEVKVWVNMVDKHGTRAMARRSRYCS